MSDDVAGRVMALLQEAHTCEDNGDIDNAVAKFTEILSIVPTLHQVQSNLGALYLSMRDFKQALSAFRSTEEIIMVLLADKEKEASLDVDASSLQSLLRETRLQIGVCASAVGNSEMAERAWKDCQLVSAAGESEQNRSTDVPGSFVAVRLCSHPFGPATGAVETAAHRRHNVALLQQKQTSVSNGNVLSSPPEFQEVVLCQRLDPAHARVECVPTPQSEHRFRDVLLVDPRVKGKRQMAGQAVPVFNELMITERSSYSTFEIKVQHSPGSNGDESVVATLVDALARADIAAEDWGLIRRVCRQCMDEKLGGGSCSHGILPITLGAGNEADDYLIGAAAIDAVHLQNTLARWTREEEGRNLIACRNVTP